MKKFLIASAILVLVIAGVWAGRPAYQRWSRQRSLTHAREFFAQADYRNASLCARKVLTHHPADLEASRIMAQIAERVKSPEAVKWRQRIVELEPGRLNNRMDLIKAALTQGDIVKARQALTGVDEAAQNTSEYHQAAALVAAAGNQFDVAERHLIEAAQLEPTHRRLQLNLAVLRLRSRDPQAAQAAEASLEQLASEPDLRLEALRQLTRNAVQKNDLAKAQLFSGRLQSESNALFDDRLLHLSILARSKNAEMKSHLARLQQEAGTRPETVLALATWMTANEMATEALRWLSGLPAKLKQQPSVAMAIADCYTARQDWAGLQVLLEEQAWAELDFLRQALLAHAAAEQKQPLAAKSKWQSAVREAADRPKALTALARMAHAWKWEKEGEDLLWLIAQRFPGERWALRDLEKSYLAQGETRGLNKVYSTLLEYDDQDLVAKNNLVTTSLLLKTQLSQAHELARQIHAAMPDQPLFATTYAYSQHLQGQTKDGLQTLEKLTSKTLETPAVAAYYGVILAAAGETNKAKKYLELARGARLLPEETALVSEALKGL